MAYICRGVWLAARGVGRVREGLQGRKASSLAAGFVASEVEDVPELAAAGRVPSHR